MAQRPSRSERHSLLPSTAPQQIQIKPRCTNGFILLGALLVMPCPLIGYAILEVGCNMPEYELETQTLPLAQKGARYVNWIDMPHRQPFSQMEALKAKAKAKFNRDEGISFGTFAPEDAVHALYEGTKVPQVLSKVPEKLRGVFWMRGNPALEELAVLQFGQWFEDEQIYVAPVAPYSWAWAYGTPKDAPGKGKMYGEEHAMGAASYLIGPAVSHSFHFSPCPQREKYCRKTEGDLTYAFLQAHVFGNMSSHHEIGAVLDDTLGLPKAVRGIATGSFTLQERKEGTQPGALWRRTCRWGVGFCQWWDAGSYDLVKILDGDGAEVKPYYDEFVQYMGGVPLLVWTGFPNRTTYDHVVRYYERLIGGGRGSSGGGL